MTELIAILALCISVLLLIVHYRNQVERRHGEISKLRSDFMQTLSGAHQRMLSTQMHLETARLELRRVRECDDKYASIEKMPRLIESAQEAVRGIAQLQSRLEGLDPAKANRGSVLMGLQSIDYDFHFVEDKVSKLEKDTLELLTSIRSEQEGADGQEAERLGKAQQARSGDA